MKATNTLVDVGPPVVRHVIRGTRLADLPVGGIEVLMHRHIELEDWKLRGATDAYWRLYWPLNRGGKVECQGARIALDPGRLYLIMPHTAFDSSCTRTFAKWYIHFTVGGLHDWGQPGVMTLRPSRRMRTLLNRTCPLLPTALGNELEPDWQLATLELIVLTLEAAFRSHQLAPANPKLSRCIHFMQERLTEKVTLQEIARFAGVSPRTLSQMFVSELGFSPIRYLLELRLNRAMKLLRYTNHSIEEVAEESGFGNRYYFTRMFVKYRQVSPAVFRKSQ
jgi:AraC-like DNA-binding protein